MTDIASLSVKADLTDLKKMVVELDKTVKASKKTETQNTKLNKSNTVLSKGFTSLKSTVIGLGSAYLGAQGLLATAKLADSYTLLNAKLKLTSDTTEEFERNYKALFDLSQETGSDFQNNASNFANMALAMESTNITSQETVQIFEAINKSLVVAGASTEEASSFMLQFRQAMGSGVLQGEEFRAMMESNSFFGLKLAEALDTDIAGLRAMSKQGKLTTDVIRAAIPEMMKEIDEKFEELPITIGRALQEVQNAWGDLVNDANTASGATESIADAIHELALSITDNKEEISSAFVGLIKTAKGATEALSALGRVWSSLMGDEITGPAAEYKKQLQEVNMQIGILLEQGERRGGLTETEEKMVAAYRAQNEQLQTMIRYTERKAEVQEAAAEKEVEVIAKSVERNVEKNTKLVSNEEKATTEITDFWDAVYDAREERIESELQAAVEANEEKVDDAKDTLAQIDSDLEDFFTDVQDINLATTDAMSGTWEGFRGSMTSSMSGFIDNLITGEFTTLQSAWTGLWSSMLGTVADTVAEMAAEFVISEVASSFFHDGTMGLKSDEYNAVLQSGEIVIPQDESNEIRQSLGTGASFEGIVDSTKAYGAAVSSTGSLLGPSEAHRLGDILGSVVGWSASKTTGVSVPGLTTAATQIGGATGGWLSESLADAFDVRSYEGLRDALESGVIGETEAQTFKSYADYAGVDNKTTLSSAFGALDSMSGYVSNAISSISAMASDAYESAISSMSSSDKLGGSIEGNTVDESLESFFSDLDSTANDTSKSDGSDAGNQGTAGGGSADDDGGNAGWGFASGGVVDKVFRPSNFGPASGDDGFISAAIGESVITANTTKKLDSFLNNGGGGVSVKIYLDSTELKKTVDNVIVTREKQNVKGRAYI